MWVYILFLTFYFLISYIERSRSIFNPLRYVEANHPVFTPSVHEKNGIKSFQYGLRRYGYRCNQRSDVSFALIEFRMKCILKQNSLGLIGLKKKAGGTLESIIAKFSLLILCRLTGSYRRQMIFLILLILPQMWTCTKRKKKKKRFALYNCITYF